MAGAVAVADDWPQAIYLALVIWAWLAWFGAIYFKRDLLLTRAAGGDFLTGGPIYFQRDLLLANLLLTRSTFNERLSTRQRDLLLTRSTFNESTFNEIYF